jgi:hypothetical protein
VLNPKALPTFIEHERDHISPEDVKLISYHLSRYCRVTNGEWRVSARYKQSNAPSVRANAQAISPQAMANPKPMGSQVILLHRPHNIKGPG